MKPTSSILLADEDPVTREFLSRQPDRRRLRTSGRRSDKATALAALETAEPDLVICDVNGDTLDLLDAIRHGDGVASRLDPDVPLIVLTAPRRRARARALPRPRRRRRRLQAAPLRRAAGPDRRAAAPQPAAQRQPRDPGRRAAHQPRRPRRADRRHAHHPVAQGILAARRTSRPNRRACSPSSELLRDVWGYRVPRPHAHARQPRLPPAQRSSRKPAAAAGSRTSGASATGSPPLDPQTPRDTRGMKRAALRRTTPLRPAGPPQRRAGLKRSGRLAPGTVAPLGPRRRARRGDGRRRRRSGARSPASGASCACRPRASRPAHLAPRSLGGCDDPDCVVPLCWMHHRAYDTGRLDLLPHLEPRLAPGGGARRAAPRADRRLPAARPRTSRVSVAVTATDRHGPAGAPADPAATPVHKEPTGAHAAARTSQPAQDRAQPRARHSDPRGAVRVTAAGLPCRLILPDGRASTRNLAPEAHVRAYLRAVVAPQDEIARYMEFPRGRRVNGELEVARWPRGNFHDPSDRRAIYEHVMSHLDRGDEMFCGPVARAEPKPRKDAARGRTRAVGRHRPQEHGAPAARWPIIERLARRRSRGSPRRAGGGRGAAALPDATRTSSCSPARAARTATGASSTPLAAEWIERANARLIHALDADWASYDRNRFLRMPGGVNGKNGRHCHLIHADLTSRAYDVRDLVGGLPDPPADDPRAPKRIRRGQTAPSAATRRDRRPDRPLDAARVLRRAVRHHRVRPAPARCRCPLA